MVCKLIGDVMDKYKVLEKRMQNIEEMNSKIFHEIDKLHKLAISNRNQIKSLKTSLKTYKKNKM